MLEEMLRDLLNAKNQQQLEIAYCNLERVGVDRYTANFLISKMSKNE